MTVDPKDPLDVRPKIDRAALEQTRQELRNDRPEPGPSDPVEGGGDPADAAADRAFIPRPMI